MTERIWDKFLTDRDKAVFSASGYGARGGFGKRPALLVIDVNWAFCGEKPEPILDAITRWRNCCRRGCLGSHAVFESPHRQGA